RSKVRSTISSRVEHLLRSIRHIADALALLAIETDVEPVDAVGHHECVGNILAAAMLQFIESDPKVQADLLTRCFQAEIHEAMEDLIEQAKAEQVKRIKHREAKEK